MIAWLVHPQEQIIEEDEARAKRIRELLANADDE